VRYLVVGGYAVAFHGHPRYTKDIDIWLARDQENAEKIVQALVDFGFALLGLSVDDFLQPELIIQLGYAPNRIDLMTDVSGVIFDDCYPKRTVEKMEDLEIDFIDQESLIKNKRASGRKQDLADLEILEQ
jgi:hypothetical protein